MPSHENYTEVHINDLRAQTGADSSILERTVFAFGLLDMQSTDVLFTRNIH